MTDTNFEMRFDPLTIKHLGVRMYSTLPPALAEIISNAYDADAANVSINLTEQDSKPKNIIITDDGQGLSYDEINEKFLVIGRNRRDKDGDTASPKYGRLPTGKKGLGKLALFGLAKTITVSTIQNGKQNEFVLDWDDLLSAEGNYYPRATIVNNSTDGYDGTVITLAGLKRKSSFDFTGLADSLSRIFIFDENFNLLIESPSGDRISINNTRKYELLNKEFEWSLESTLYVPETSEYHGQMSGELITAIKPITPNSGLRGITLFSRGKLVNAPEFFSSSTSSHFYQYLTGWISVNFIDLLDEDVISTNRQSIDWEHPEMEKLREFLSGIVSQINIDWRKKRKEKKDKELKEKTGIDTEAWVNTLPEGIKKSTEQIIASLGGEDALEKFTPIVKALHDIVPEYPSYHWRHLHPEIQIIAKDDYIGEKYFDAAEKASRLYIQKSKDKASHDSTNDSNAMALIYNVGNGLLKVTNCSDTTEKNIQNGQELLSKGIVAGCRNPLTHNPEYQKKLVDTGLFTEKDCLDMLSMISHLFTRLENAELRKNTEGA